MSKKPLNYSDSNEKLDFQVVQVSQGVKKLSLRNTNFFVSIAFSIIILSFMLIISQTITINSFKKTVINLEKSVNNLEKSVNNVEKTLADFESQQKKSR